jgi:hypothetical protein
MTLQPMTSYHEERPVNKFSTLYDWTITEPINQPTEPLTALKQTTLLTAQANA